jgi:hypothetical protein
VDEPRSRADARIIKAAFGSANRARLLDIYFGEHGAPTAATAWADVYRLLLWIDQTNGLAHCYESDKSQPGRHWYPRSLSFHDWVSGALGCSPSTLGDQVDWLFKKATAELAVAVLSREAARLAAAAQQRAPFEGRGLPVPGEDPELVSIITEVLGGHIVSPPPAETWQLLVQRVRQYLTVENKRRNLVGEGFEDVIQQIVIRTTGHLGLEVHARELLHELPGFNRARHGDKPNKVDVAILRPSHGGRVLVTAKWSIRADREKQFASDYADYVGAESERRPFEYVLVTNEFDPARLRRACEALSGNAHMFSHVVHINTEALLATYGETPESTVAQHIASGRLIGLEAWLNHLALPAK